MNLTLSIDSTSIINWYVEESYATHDDYKWCTGEMVMLGKGTAKIEINHKEIHRSISNLC